MLPHVMIATPCKDGKVDVNYAIDLAATCQVLNRAGIKHRISTACTSSIDNGRSCLATLFLKTDSTHLLFIDDDMAWAPDLPLRMLNEHVDIVGVPYRKKKPELEYTVRHGLNVGMMQDHPWMMKVDAIGMGMTLIDRKVLEKLALDVPEYHFYSHEKKDPQKLFFRHDLVDDGKGNIYYESEDFNFCRLAREKGFDIWAYVDEVVPHIGRTAFVGRYSDQVGADTEHGFTAERERMTVNLLGVEM